MIILIELLIETYYKDQCWILNDKFIQKWTTIFQVATSEEFEILFYYALFCGYFLLNRLISSANILAKSAYAAASPSADFASIAGSLGVT